MKEDALPDKLYYSIAEVSDYFDLAPSLLRYWETEFRSISPKRNKKGTRFYSKKDLEAIKLIQHLVKEQGYTIKGAKDKIRKEKDRLTEKVEAIDKLKEIRSFLVDIKDKL